MNTPVPVTVDLLRLAWRQVRRRPGWPATLEDALSRSTYRTCLYGIARNLGRERAKRAAPMPLFAHQPQQGRTP